MRTSVILFAVLLLAGCENPRATAPFSPEQAGKVSLQLANDKADAVYHRRPFQGSQPAHYEAGRWVWIDGHGVGTFDFQAKVELAANGSTNHVDIRVLEDVIP